jgi:PHD/YefM family antitoxin component YafN of YafNO toxin-antitoxin module
MTPVSAFRSVPLMQVFVSVRGQRNTAMNVLHPQFVVDENKKPQAVILPVTEWEQVIEDLEELDDIRAYDQAKTGCQEAIPFEQAVREIEEGSCE